MTVLIHLAIPVIYGVILFIEKYYFWNHRNDPKHKRWGNGLFRFWAASILLVPAVCWALELPLWGLPILAIIVGGWVGALIGDTRG